MCVNKLLRVALESASAESRTHAFAIDVGRKAAPYHYATEPHASDKQQ